MKLSPIGLAAALCIAFAGCCTNGNSRLVNNEFVNYLQQAGYASLPMPSSLQTGGSLVYVKNDGKNKRIEWVGDLLSCGVPNQVIFGASPEKLTNVHFPTFSGGSVNDCGANAALTIKGVRANANTSVIRRTIFTVKDAGSETIQRLEVANYLADPIKRQNLKDFCLDAINNEKGRNFGRCCLYRQRRSIILQGQHCISKIQRPRADKGLGS